MTLKKSHTDRAIHSQQHNDLLCPITGQVEPMLLQLYERETKSWHSHKILKAPVAKFFRIEGMQEIDEPYWTGEMKKACSAAIKAATPLANRKSELTLLGKIVAGLVVAIVIYVAYLIGSYYLIERPNRLQFESEVRRMPEVGDMYYVEVNDQTEQGHTPFVGQTWAKVLNVYLADSTIKLQLDQDFKRATSDTTNTAQASPKNFSGYIYTTKFVPKSDGDKLYVDFEVIGRHASIRFTPIYKGEMHKISINPVK